MPEVESGPTELQRLSATESRQRIGERERDAREQRVHDTIIGNAELMAAIEGSETRSELLTNISDVELPEGVKASDVVRAREELGVKAEAEKPPARKTAGELDALARTRVMELVDQVGTGQDLDDPAVVSNVAAQALATVTARIKKSNEEGYGLEPAELEFLFRTQRLLSAMQGGSSDAKDAMKELGYGTRPRAREN
jgi:hypothetical protein